ncbi:MAG: type 4a pilus biogenesis protein PilO [Gaiellaceae bacterium]
MKAKPSNPAVVALIVVGVIAYLAVGYLLLISPQRSKSSDLKKQIAQTESQIAQYRALSARARSAAPIRVADLFRLEKAMPNEVDMAGIVLELSRIARDTGIRFESISPGGPVLQTGYHTLPVTLVFDGNYFELSDFLYRLRTLVRVRSGRLAASGRLFSVESIGFSESVRSFPRIQASLVVNAYVYGDTPLPGMPGAATTPPATSTGQTATTSTPTTTIPAATTPTTTQPTPPATPPPGATAAPAPTGATG